MTLYTTRSNRQDQNHKGIYGNNKKYNINAKCPEGTSHIEVT